MVDNLKINAVFLPSEIGYSTMWLAKELNEVVNWVYKHEVTRLIKEI